MELDRRAFLAAAARAGLALPALSGLGALAACAGRGEPHAPEDAATATRFLHGVASGDPLADRVVLWTRVAARAATPVRWRVARDAELREVVGEGRTLAAPERDFTVKLDVAGLEPGTTYWYGFEALGEASPVGRTRTLPAGSAGRLRLAFASCANLTQGYWNAYAAIARRDDLDVVLHLGDYIYEFPNGVYGDGTALGRVPEPDRELVTLADYRTRYAQYRRDPDLQALHARHPMIAVWDDHELADDAWLGGAGNHQPASEGRWADRRSAAVRAYREWLPVREEGMPAPEDKPRLYRSFRIGDLAELAMLDTRLAGRAHQIPAAERALLADPARSMLGAEQEAWLFERLASSQREGVAWRLVGQQVMVGQLRTPQGLIRNADSWDGYPAARERLLRRIQADSIDNVVVLSGDVHSSWGVELALDPFDPQAYDPRAGRGALAVELVCPAISSAPPVADASEAETRAAACRASHPHVRYVDLWKRGYGLLDLDPERARMEWWHVEGVEQRGLGDHLGAALETRSGTNQLV